MDDIVAKYFEVDEYKPHIQTNTYKKGELILSPDDDSSYIYAISKGFVKIYNLDSRGKEYIAVIYGPGDFFPFAWLIGQKRPPIYFKAITDSEVHVVPRKIFQKHLKDDINLSNSFMSKVLEQFSYYATTVNNLGFKYGKERLYYRLLVLAARFGENKNKSIFLPHISHSDFGATIHISREVINKEIIKLEKLGVLEYNRAHIKINNVEYLRKELGKDVPIVFFNTI